MSSSKLICFHIYIHPRTDMKIRFLRAPWKWLLESLLRSELAYCIARLQKKPTLRYLLASCFCRFDYFKKCPQSITTRASLSPHLQAMDFLCRNNPILKPAAIAINQYSTGGRQMRSPRRWSFIGDKARWASSVQ
jgi:hypothetical protein